MKVLLDSNAYSALQRGQELVVEQVRRSEGTVMEIPTELVPAVRELIARHGR